MKRFFLTLLLLIAPLGASALDSPQERLGDPALEQRAEHLGAQLRCLVCQNESIEDSSAGLARDLRRIVREQVKAGRSDQQIMDWMTQRYGNFIRLKPVFDLQTALLWCMPVLALLIGLGAAWRIWKSPRTEIKALSDDEKKRLKTLLSKE
ncbi:cytochrome c-type biogenesis protein CcmH [Acetobacteraceae bacterium ESL0709]|nr:cytochrome c-type biogenesis protein CcmH [Acetobacteraceae bacterium ESL0697]MDF7677563.1 cytochrome c-type biogenesis protein CcmH [Acetobacteraceae bacterium ESL0709]